MPWGTCQHVCFLGGYSKQKHEQMYTSNGGGHLNPDIVFLQLNPDSTGKQAGENTERHS